MITGRHLQNAYITRNIDKALEQFKKHADFRDVSTIEAPIEVWTPKGSGIGTHKLAFVWVEDLQIELIQPGPEDVLALYTDELPEDDRIKFHHVCHMVPDWDVFMAQVEKQPYPIAIRGGWPGVLQFLYLDTREWLGHYVEYIWTTPERWIGMGVRQPPNA